jgi:hypothetical protein
MNMQFTDEFFDEVDKKLAGLPHTTRPMKLRQLIEKLRPRIIELRTVHSLSWPEIIAELNNSGVKISKTTFFSYFEDGMNATEIAALRPGKRLKKGSALPRNTVTTNPPVVRKPDLKAATQSPAAKPVIALPKEAMEVGRKTQGNAKYGGFERRVEPDEI